MNKKKLLFFIFFPIFFANAQCFTNVVSSQSTIILRKSDGTLWARGDNNTGLVGNGTTADVVDLIQIGSDSDWSNEFCAGYDKAYAIKENGTLWYWGGNSEAFLPTQIGTETDWVKVNASSYAVAAIKSNGTLWTMGKNFEGVLGTGNTDDSYIQTVPIQVGTSSDWQSIFSGDANFYAIKTNNTLWSWGKPTVLGYQEATGNDHRYPHQVNADTWKTISGCFNKTLGIKTDGTLYGWGSDSQHLISLNGFNQYPFQIGTDTDWKMIDVAQNFVIGVKENHTRWGWGSNWQNNLGNGNIINISQPTQLESATDWEMVNIDVNGSGISGGIKQNGTHYIWKGIWPPLNNGVYQFPIPTVIFQSCTLSITDFKNDLFVIYPNPVDAVLHLQTEKNIMYASVSIYNTIGQKIKTFSVNNKEDDYEMDVSFLQSGIYCLIIEGQNFSSKKIIIKK